MGWGVSKSAARYVCWEGELPAECDCCSRSLSAIFVDCKTIYGCWAALCVSCAGELAVASCPPLCRVFQLSQLGWVSFF